MKQRNARVYTLDFKDKKIKKCFTIVIGIQKVCYDIY